MDSFLIDKVTLIDNASPFILILEDLKEIDEQAISEKAPAAFMQVDEPFLRFTGDVKVEGEASFAGLELLLKLSIEATAVIPCTICGAPVEEKIVLDPLYHSEEIATLTSPYSYAEVIRESILLETPTFIECRGKCPKREELSPFFADKEGKNELKEQHQPFKNFFKDENN